MNKEILRKFHILNVLAKDMNRTLRLYPLEIEEGAPPNVTEWGVDWRCDLDPTLEEAKTDRRVGNTDNRLNCYGGRGETIEEAIKNCYISVLERLR